MRMFAKIMALELSASNVLFVWRPGWHLVVPKAVRLRELHVAGNEAEGERRGRRRSEMLCAFEGKADVIE